LAPQQKAPQRGVSPAYIVPLALKTSPRSDARHRGLRRMRRPAGLQGSGRNEMRSSMFSLGGYRLSCRGQKRRGGMADPMSQNDDRYARESFTWRRMKPWQLWGITGVLIVLVILALIWLF
jgi:hypothetical protein